MFKMGFEAETLKHKANTSPIKLVRPTIRSCFSHLANLLAEHGLTCRHFCRIYYVNGTRLNSGEKVSQGSLVDPTLRKKIYLLHLERIVKHFLNLLIRNIDFQDIRIR